MYVTPSSSIMLNRCLSLVLVGADVRDAVLLHHAEPLLVVGLHHHAHLLGGHARAGEAIRRQQLVERDIAVRTEHAAQAVLGDAVAQYRGHLPREPRRLVIAALLATHVGLWFWTRLLASAWSWTRLG